MPEEKRDKIAEVNIGAAIEAVMKEQGISPTVMARKLNCERQNIYNIYKRRSIDSELLARISKILGVRFYDMYDG